MKDTPYLLQTRTPSDPRTIDLWREATLPGTEPGPDLTETEALEDELSEGRPYLLANGPDEELREANWDPFDDLRNRLSDEVVMAMLTELGRQADRTIGNQLESAESSLESFLGRQISPQERADLRAALQRKATDEAIRLAARGPDSWTAADLEDGITFALGADTPPPPLWGDADYGLWPTSEFAVFFGASGSYKTTVTHNLLMGLARVPGFEECLGLPVAALADGEKALYLALDRQYQSRRSLKRLIGQLDGRDRQRFQAKIDVWRQPVPVNAAINPDELVSWVLELAAARGTTYRAVILDNVTDAFGDMADTGNAMAAGQALNRLANLGVNVLALSHSKKIGGGEPSSIDDLYGGTMFSVRSGSVLSLWVQSRESSLVSLRQFKKPYGDDFVGKFLWDNSTGRPGPVSLGDGETFTPFDERVRQALEALGTAPVRDVAETVYGGSVGDPEKEKVRRVLNLAEWAEPVQGTTGKTVAYRYTPEDE